MSEYFDVAVIKTFDSIKIFKILEDKPCRPCLKLESDIGDLLYFYKCDVLVKKCKIFKDEDLYKLRSKTKCIIENKFDGTFWVVYL